MIPPVDGCKNLGEIMDFSACITVHTQFISKACWFTSRMYTNPTHPIPTESEPNPSPLSRTTEARAFPGFPPLPVLLPHQAFSTEIFWRHESCHIIHDLKPFKAAHSTENEMNTPYQAYTPWRLALHLGLTSIPTMHTSFLSHPQNR